MHQGHIAMSDEMIFPEAEDSRNPSRVLVWSAVVLLFLIIHFPHDVRLLDGVLYSLQHSEMLNTALTKISGKYARSTHDTLIELAVRSLIVPAKAIGFLFSVVVLFFPIVSSLKTARWLWSDGKLKQRCLDAMLLFSGLALLVIPRFLQSLGDEYGRMSLSPFTEPRGLYHKRLLMPACAHLFGASGYLWYFFFSLLCTCALIFTTRLWFEAKGIRLTRLVAFSVLTSSFVMYNFQMPGYPEQLAFVLILLGSVVPMTSAGRIAIVALALATHEGLVFVLAPLVWFLFPRRERWQALNVIVVYGIILWIGGVAAGSALTESFVYRDESGLTALQYLTAKPFLAFAGVLFAYKLFWFIILASVIAALRSHDVKTPMVLSSLVCLPLFTLPLAVDASRLVGWGFLGLLCALFILHTKGVFSERQLQYISIANLIIPSCYVGLNSGVNLLPGIYTVWQSVAALFG
jgi:hypothetical protein